MKGKNKTSWKNKVYKKTKILTSLPEIIAMNMNQFNKTNKQIINFLKNKDEMIFLSIPYDSQSYENNIRTKLT